MSGNKNKCIIPEVIGKLRAEAAESQQDLADALGVKRETVKFWESGDRQIKAADVAQLARHYNVSADYLLGLTDTRSADLDIKTICRYTHLSEAAVASLNTEPLIGQELSAVISDNGFRIAGALGILGEVIEHTEAFYSSLAPLVKEDPENFVLAFTTYERARDRLDAALLRVRKQVDKLGIMQQAQDLADKMNDIRFVGRERYGEHKED